MPKDDDFDRSVFVNCPLDEDYDRILRAVRFGLIPRIATERGDAGEPRISKILDLIQSSRYSVHDLCRCQARDEGEYYRLNMPFELGLDFGCRRYGAGQLSTKVILVLEEQRLGTPPPIRIHVSTKAGQLQLRGKPRTLGIG